MALGIDSIEQLCVGDLVFIDGFKPELVSQNIQKLSGSAQPEFAEETESSISSGGAAKEIAQNSYAAQQDRYPRDLIYVIAAMDMPKI